MDSIEFITATANLPYLIAGCVVLGVLILELLSVMVGHSMMLGDQDIDFTADLNGNGIPDYLEVDHGVHGGLLSWLNPSSVPFMIFLVVFCAIFAALGYVGQTLYWNITAALVPGIIGGPVVLAMTLPVCRLATAGLARVLPRDLTTAIDTSSLTGSRGVVNVGPVTDSSSGAARFTDQYGTDHNLIVFAEPGVTVPLGSSVILMGPHREKFYASVIRLIPPSQ